MSATTIATQPVTTVAQVLAPSTSVVTSTAPLPAQPTTPATTTTSPVPPVQPVQPTQPTQPIQPATTQPFVTIIPVVVTEPTTSTTTSTTTTTTTTTTMIAPGTTIKPVPLYDANACLLVSLADMQLVHPNIASTQSSFGGDSTTSCIGIDGDARAIATGFSKEVRVFLTRLNEQNRSLVQNQPSNRPGNPSVANPIAGLGTEAWFYVSNIRGDYTFVMFTTRNHFVQVVGVSGLSGGQQAAIVEIARKVAAQID